MTGQKHIGLFLLICSLIPAIVFAADSGQKSDGKSISKVFQVTVADKDSSHPFYGIGHTIGFVVDGVQGKALVLTRGETYIFDIRTNIKHDFYLTTSTVGRGAGTVTQGVKGQFTYIGKVLFTPSRDTPDIMYYQCRNHPNMGGPLYIVNQGEGVDLSMLQAANKALQTLQQAPDKRHRVKAEQVQQKIDFAALLVNDSAIAKRIEKSELQVPRDMRRQALVLLQQGRQLLQQGVDLDGAMADARQAIELINRAGQQLPGGAEDVDQQALYKKLLRAIADYSATYQREYNRMVAKKGALAGTLNQHLMQQLVDTAREQAKAGHHAAANEKLQQAERLVTNALSILLDNETVVFEKKFASPRDEYEWESARHQSYTELIPIAMQQRRPGEKTVRLMNQFVSKSIVVRKQAQALARKGDYRQAIQAIQAATDHLRTALRLAGVQ